MKNTTLKSTALVSTAALLASLWGAAVWGRKRWAAGSEKIRSELEAHRVHPVPEFFSAQALDALPAAVKRYFQTVLTDGQPIIAGATVAHEGVLNMSETQTSWKPFTSTQRVITRRRGFDWDARVRVLPGVAVLIHDTYVAGRGHVQASMLGLYSMADLVDSPDLNRGELMRFFAEAVWYPTALLPSQGVHWTAIDDNAALATLSDSEITLTMVFRFNAEGLIETVRAEDRGRMVGLDITPTPWQGHFSNYVEREGMRVPLEAEVAWLLPDGEKTYWRAKITSLAYQFAQ